MMRNLRVRLGWGSLAEQEAEGGLSLKRETVKRIGRSTFSRTTDLHAPTSFFWLRLLH